ncbi:hypothetical protein [Microbulbifer hainanensis]|uniref:hypothetical protein n=1 Tax=Microbulbifer hainanensis TaxID=2735675 RepID=UPI00186667CD|nr:hypothetical protein [Microbulbifer hainanensis]
MARPTLCLIAVLCLLPAATAQQIVSVDPGVIWLQSDASVNRSITWRLASRGGANSSHGEFVNLGNNQVLARVDRPLGITADSGTVSEQLRLSAAQAHKWYAAGVRRLGYRRTFSGDAGTLSNRVVIDLRGSGRLIALSASPDQQTLTPNSQRMMVVWTLSSDIGEVNAGSVSGLFTVGDRVIYSIEEPLYNSGAMTVREVVELPPGLVADLLASGIDRVRYSRTFIDDKDSRRSASVMVNLSR